MYNRAYLSYLPQYLGRIREIRELSAVIDAHMEKEESENDAILREGIINTAEGIGLEMWEELLGITKGGTAEERRIRILSFLADSTPYSFTAVLNTLKSICGEDMVSMNYGAEEYTLEVWIKPAAQQSKSVAESILERLLPANMIFRVNIDYTRHIDIEEKTHTKLSGFKHGEIREGTE